MLHSFHILLSSSFISASTFSPINKRQVQKVLTPAPALSGPKIIPPRQELEQIPTSAGTLTNSQPDWNSNKFPPRLEFKEIPTQAGTQTNSHSGWNLKKFPPRLEEVFLSVARGEFHLLHSIGIKVELKSEANIYLSSCYQQTNLIKFS